MIYVNYLLGLCRSSFVRHTNRVQLHDLPKLIDSPPGKRDSLYIQKLQLCSVVLIFDSPSSDGAPGDVEDFEGKDIKKRTLQELVQYLESPGGQKMATTEEAIRELVECVVLANNPHLTQPRNQTYFALSRHNLRRLTLMKMSQI